MDPLASSDNESAVRPVEATVDPAPVPVDGHDSLIKSEAANTAVTSSTSEVAISGDSTIDDLLAVAALTEVVATAVPPPEQVASQPSHSEKPAKKDKKTNDSFLPDETLALVQRFLTEKVALNQCGSNSKDVLEFVGRHMDDKQRRRYVGPLVQRIVDQFAMEARAKGEDVSVDLQTSACLLEQMFLTLGRESPLQDMYTQEEEEMLDLLFHAEGDAASTD